MWSYFLEIRKLNALRGLAAIIVFITHFSDITNWLDGALGGGSGAYGVMLFFLLSGFLTVLSTTLTLPPNREV